jgi:hypothetical protein
MKLPCGLLLSVYLATGVTSVFAQDLDPALNIDLPTTAIHGSDIAHVDLQSGALTINIPLVHLKGRGLDTDFMYTAGNKNWHYEFVDTGYISFHSLSFFDERNDPRIGQSRMGTWDGPLGGTILSPDLPYGLVASTFTQNTGPVTTLINVEGVIATQPAAPNGYWSFDRSYMYADPATGGIYYKDGVRTRSITSNVDNGSSSYTQDDNVLEDTNGNTITCTSISSSITESCIDTLGRHVDISYGAINTSVSYRDSSNTARTATISTSGVQTLDYPWRPTNECDPIIGASNNCVAVSHGPCPESTEITLGEGSTYHLYYVQNADGTTTCEVSKIELPTGGYIRFEYGWLGTGADVPKTGPNDVYTAMLYASHRAVIKRFESSDGTAGSEKVWNYSYTCTDGICGGSPPGGAAYTETTTVTDPLQNTHKEVFYQGVMFDGNPAPIPYVTMTEDRDSLGVLLHRTENTTGFDSSSYSVLRTDQIRDNPRVTSAVETLGGSSQTSTTAMQYDAYGNVNDKKYYDFNSSLLRWEEHTYLPTSDPSYAANNVHILDRVTTDIVHGDSGTCTSPVNSECSRSPTHMTSIVMA